MTMTLGPAIEWMLRNPMKELIDNDGCRFRHNKNPACLQAQIAAIGVWVELCIEPSLLNLTFEVPDE